MKSRNLLLGFVFLLLVAIAGIIGYASRQGSLALFLVYVLYLLNLLLIWYIRGFMYVVLVVLAFVGFLLSIPRISRKPRSSSSPSVNEEPHSMVFDVPPSPPIAKSNEKKENAK